MKAVVSISNMAESGRYQSNIVININTTQGDRVEEIKETNVINSIVDKVNVAQKGGNDKAAEGSSDRENFEGIPEVANLASAIASNEGSTSSGQGRKRSSEVLEEKRNTLKCGFLQVQAATLCAQTNFLEASKQLEKMRRLLQGDVGVNALLVQIEVCMQLDKKEEAEQAIEDIARLSMVSPSDADELITFASELIKDESYVRACFLLRILSEIYVRNSALTARDKFDRISKCISQIDFAILPMLNMRGTTKLIAITYALPYMAKMVDDSRKVERVDPVRKAVQESWSLNWLGLNYRLVNKYDKSIDTYESAIDSLERQFGENASKNQIYGFLLSNLGLSNFDLAKYEIAEKCYKKALSALNNASDFITEDEKQKHIAETRNNSRINDLAKT